MLTTDWCNIGSLRGVLIRVLQGSMLLAIIVIMMEEVKQQCKSHCTARNMIIPVLKVPHTKCLTVLSYVTHPVFGAIHSVNTLYVELCPALSILRV